MCRVAKMRTKANEQRVGKGAELATASLAALCTPYRTGCLMVFSLTRTPTHSTTSLEFSDLLMTVLQKENVHQAGWILR